jgi:hypothetical protein
VPADLVGANPSAADFADYLEGKIRGDDDDAEFELVSGWFCRLSAPGYMDCTDWSGPYETEQEARDYIAEQYDVDPDNRRRIDRLAFSFVRPRVTQRRI